MKSKDEMSIVPGLRSIRMSWGEYDDNDRIHITFVTSENDANEILGMNYEGGQAAMGDFVSEILRGKIGSQLPNELSSESVYQYS